MPGRCHSSAAPQADPSLRKIVLVGNPNVGKSALFNRITGAYVVVSNYPGTTVEVSRGRLRLGSTDVEVEDTPGMYSLLPITEEERVARDILLESHADAVLHVVDAKNLKRMLPMTLQLIEAGLPVVLVLNMIDEAERLGVRIDTDRLARSLGVPVATTAALTGRGVKELIARLGEAGRGRTLPEIYYGPEVESAIARVEPLVPARSGLCPRALALLLLQGDERLEETLGLSAADVERVAEARREVERRAGAPASLLVPERLHDEAARLADEVFRAPEAGRVTWAERLSKWMMHPVTGLPILAVVLYYGLYKFVGGFGAGTVVDFLEGHLFETYVNPWVNDAVTRWIPWRWLQELIGLDYGVVTLGLRYAVAIILPIVGTFFIAFSIIEDSGYLPRLAMLVDRLFKSIGLNGRAVIPMTLGFGCDTMATMVTRTLETTRERIIATVLLALAIPCSAQLGVILGMMSAEPRAMAVWAGFVIGVFLLIGWLTARILPGDPPMFYMEIPPLRLPRPGAVAVKTLTRMQWYFAEILPLFLLASVLIWLGKITGLFDAAVSGLGVVMGWIGLPKEAAVAFLFGFFRRDYGAAGLYDLQTQGLLTGNQLAVAAITLTLFVPCIAQFLVMQKERGTKTALAIAGFVFVFAFGVGALVNGLLTVLGVQL
ncbi:MAG: ferrous iron transport protein B [Deltaproteobacteria bacterium]|nr:ferrous iron transport protein B [Deltaproteobacteria bacterium]